MSRKIAHREYGHGPLIVLLHGYGGSVMQWQSLADQLKQHGRVVVPNLAHLFLSKRPMLFSVQIQRIAEFLDEHFPGERAHLVGTSFGGALAWGLARQDPAKVDRLSLLNPLMPDPVAQFRAPEMRALFERPLKDHEMLEMFKTPTGQAFLKFAAETFRPSRDLAERRLATLSEVKLAFIADIVAHFSWILRNEDWVYWRNSLAEITAPKLVISTEDDRLFDSRAYQEFARNLSSHRHVILPEGGHALATTQANRVAEEIIRFMTVERPVVVAA